MTAPVRYAIKQVSTYTYASGVPFARHVVRLAPVTRPGLVVEAATVRIDPEPDERSERRDFFGNATLDIALERPHRKLEIACTAMVNIARPVPIAAATTPAWEQVRAEVAVTADAGPAAPVHHLFASRLVPVDLLIRTWAAESFPPGVPVLAGGLSLMARIKKEFTYDPEATDVTTPTREAFALRRGVCQDFAHVMICGLRSLGLPAAYVSGYLRTLPPPGKPRLEGADAMHAWVALWCGEAAGWQGLDPTNDIRAGTDHIVVAIGRDYADVSPIDGVIIAAGGHSLEVGVDVVER
ncbi:MAG: transglutaminase family protein [Hyphomicrobiaceae bacterium]